MDIQKIIDKTAVPVSSDSSNSYDQGHALILLFNV